MLEATRLFVFLYGSLVSYLGLWGYLQTGSLPSLISGCSLGVVCILTSRSIRQDQKKGLYASMLTVFFLGAVFLYRYTQTQKPTPGWMAILSLAMLCFLFYFRVYQMSAKQPK